MRHNILAFTLAGAYWSLYEVIKPLPKIHWNFLITLILAITASIIVLYWNRLPFKPIKQRVNPDRWVTARMENLDDSQYLMFHDVMGVDFVDVSIRLNSELGFPIKLRYLRGKGIIKGQETHLILEEKNDIELPKHGVVADVWRLYGWTVFVLNINEENSSFALDLIGEDDRHRKYDITTQNYTWKR